MDFPQTLPQIKAATVLIGLPPEQTTDRTPGQGSGFLVATTLEPLVVTSRHVIEPYMSSNLAQWLRVWVPATPRLRPCKVLGYLSEAESGLCLLKIEADEPLPEPLSLAWDDNVSEGQSVALCGYPYGFTNLFKRGEIGLRGVNSFAQCAMIGALWPYATASGSEVTMIQLDAITNPGNSGGPVFLPESGKVIGVVSGYLQNRVHGQAFHTGITEALPIHYLRSLFEKAQQAPEPVEETVTT